MELTALSVKPGVGRSADVATHSHDICVTQSSGPLDITPPTSNEGSNQGKPLKFKIFLVLQLFMDTAVITHDNSGRRATYNVIFYCQSSSLLIFCVIFWGLNYSECPTVTVWRPVANLIASHSFDRPSDMRCWSGHVIDWPAKGWSLPRTLVVDYETGRCDIIASATAALVSYVLSTGATVAPRHVMTHSTHDSSWTWQANKVRLAAVCWQNFNWFWNN